MAKQPRRKPIARHDLPQKVSPDVVKQLSHIFLRRGGSPQPDNIAPSVPTWYSSPHYEGMLSAQNAFRGWVHLTWYRNPEGDMDYYLVRYRKTQTSGTSTSSGVGSLTDSGASWGVDAYIGATVTDADGNEFFITDNTATVLTLDTTDTPATGSYTIYTPYKTDMVDHPERSLHSLSLPGSPPAKPDVVRSSVVVEMDGKVYDFSVCAVDNWGNHSGYSTVEQVTTPAPPTLIDGPANLSYLFDGPDAVFTWDAPTEVGPERDYHIEVRTTGGGAIKEEYYQASNTLTITYDENARMHSGTASATLHITVYTRDIAGNESSSSLTQTATNAAPSTPTGLAATSRAGGVVLTWDHITEIDVDEVLVYRYTSDVSGSASIIAVVDGRLTSYTDTNATTGTYYYWLKARDVFEQTSSFTSSVNALLASDSSIQGWTQNLGFHADSNVQVGWTAADAGNEDIKLADGTAYNITAGDTGTMSAITYIYLDINTSTTVLQTSIDPQAAVGAGKILLCVAQNVESGKDARFIAYGGDSPGSPTLITASNIAAGTITANEILGNTITAAEITTDWLTGVKIKVGTPSSEEVELDSDGIAINVPGDYSPAASYQFVNGSTLIGALQAQYKSGEYYMLLSAPAVTGSDSRVTIQPVAPSGYNSRIMLNAMETGGTTAINLYALGSTSSYYINANREFQMDDSARIIGSLRVGTTGSPPTNSIISVIDTSLTTTTSYTGIDIDLTKTAGATDYQDWIAGITVNVGLSDAADDIGHLYAGYFEATVTSGYVGSVVNPRDVYPVFALADLNGGTVRSDVFGVYAEIDQEAGSTVSNNAYGMYVNVAADGTVTGSVYGIYIASGTFNDYGIYQVNGLVPNYFAGDVRIGSGLYVGADSDAPTDCIIADDYIIAMGGIRIGSNADPGTDNLVVDGTSQLTGIVTCSSYLTTVGGIHVGGTSDPGTDRLLVDDYAVISGGLRIGSAADPGTANLSVQLVSTLSGVVNCGSYLTTVGGIHVGGTSDPGTDRLLVDDYIVAVGGVRVGSAADPGTNNLSVAGYAAIASYVTVTDYVAASGGVHVGGTSDPGTDVLIVDGTTYIGDTANANVTLGLTINQGGSDNTILAFKSSDVAHGMTTIVETDSFADFRKIGADEGGLFVRGFSETGRAQGLLLGGIATDEDATRSTAGTAAVEVRSYLKSGTSAGNMSADKNMVCFRDAATTRFIFDSDGEMHCDAAIGSGSDWDDWDDLALAADLSRLPQAKFNEMLKYRAEDFEKAGLLTLSVDENGERHAFIKTKAMLQFSMCCFAEVAKRLDKTEEQNALLMEKLDRYEKLLEEGPC